MDHKRVKFIVEANKLVNEILVHIERMTELTDKTNYGYTSSDVGQIFAALHLGVAQANKHFSRVDGGASSRFMLPFPDIHVDRIPDVSGDPFANTIASLMHRRQQENIKNRSRHGKPIASDEPANYLLKQIAKVLLLPARPIDIPISTWLGTRSNIIVLDASKAAQTLKPSLQNAPQSMIKGRLKVIARFAPEVAFIRAIRPPRHFYISKSIDKRHAVILYLENKLDRRTSRRSGR